MSAREYKLLSMVIAGFIAASSGCMATAPISVADRQSAKDAEVELAVCVTEGEKPNLFFNPLPKMLADQVESRYRPPQRPYIKNIKRLPFGAEPDGCDVVIAMRADGQAIWNLRHAILTNAYTKEELMRTSSKQACGPCVAGMMDGIILPIINALDSKGPLHARIKGGKKGGAPLVAAKRPAAMIAAAPASGMMIAAKAAAPAAEPAPEPAAEASAAQPEAQAAVEAPPAPEPKAKLRPLSDFSAEEMLELDAQIFP